MHFLHGFLWWLSGHCWGCRFGARWRQQAQPDLANRAFVKTSFLRFVLSLTLLDSAAIALTYTTPFHSTGAAIALSCMIVGLVTGVPHGRETYSPL